jgi:phosphatidate cytidylyltransferase
MLKLRILSVVVALPLFVAAMFVLPNSWWSVALLAPLLVAGHEWGRLAGLDRGAKVVFFAALVMGCAVLWIIAIPAADRLVPASAFSDRAIYALGTAFWCVIAPCWLWLKIVVRKHIVLAAAGFIVLVPTWLALVRLQCDPRLLLLLLAVVWIADSAAYFTGRALGGRKLASAISPGKTWAGVGGAFVAVAVYAWTLHFSLILRLDLHIMIAIFFSMTALSITGDLLESWLKRAAGVKDSGSIFPGHGGMLDRIDGVTAALPLAALMFT